MPENQPSDPDPTQPQAPVPPQTPPFQPVAPPAQPQAPGIPYQNVPAASPQAPGGSYPVAPQARTNTLAVIALIGGFITGIVGIVCGHIALSQIKKTGEKGHGLALAGTIIGYVNVIGTVIGVTLLIVFAGMAATSFDAAADDLSESLDSQIDTPSFGDVTEEPATDAEYSSEFCDTLMEMAGSEDTVTGADGSISAETKDLFKRLSEFESPNQSVYQRFYAVVEDPSAFQDDTTLMDDYMDAISEDVSACI